MDANGQNARQLTPRGLWGSKPTWAPDGSRIAFFASLTGTVVGEEIYVMNVDGSDMKRLTFTDGEDRDPAWSPDGKFIAFASRRDGYFRIYLMRPDGRSQKPISDAGGWEPRWSPR